jgi:hypothetical protein
MSEINFSPPPSPLLGFFDCSHHRTAAAAAEKFIKIEISLGVCMHDGLCERKERMMQNCLSLSPHTMSAC